MDSDRWVLTNGQMDRWILPENKTVIGSKAKQRKKEMSQDIKLFTEIRRGF